MLTLALFGIGFVLLIKGADLLVDGASSIARKFSIAPIVIGLTIVSFGTSAPELVVNLIASFEGNTDIAIGNILGSNIANILLILGISAIIFPLTSKENTVWKEIPLSFLAALLLGIMAQDGLIEGASYSGLTRIDGAVFLAFFIVFMYYTFGISKVSGQNEGDDIQEMPMMKSVGFVIAGLIGLTIGGKWIVTGAVYLATILGMSQAVIGLTIVAIGTSLPELATSAIAAYKKQTDIAIGNVVGSNIFNIFWILGISALIKPLPFAPSSQIDIAMTILASGLLFAMMFIGRRHTVGRIEGVIMLLLYAVYLSSMVFLR